MCPALNFSNNTQPWLISCLFPTTHAQHTIKWAYNDSIILHIKHNAELREANVSLICKNIHPVAICKRIKHFSTKQNKNWSTDAT